MSRIRVVVHGALGKMGQEVIKAVNQDSETELTGVVDQYLSKDSSEIPNCPITVPSSNQISELLLNTDEANLQPENFRLFTFLNNKKVFPIYRQIFGIP